LKPIAFAAAALALAAFPAAFAVRAEPVRAEPVRAEPAARADSLVHAPLASRLPVMLPRVIDWAEKLSGEGRARGERLTPAQERLARASGVRDPASVRLLVVDGIPLPDEPELQAAALDVGLSQSSAAGMTVGYTVVVRRGYERDVRLLSHELRHVAQYEASGGIRPFLAMHLADLVAFGYEDSPFEVDARAHEQDGAPRLRRASGTH
jgi:hypothetical protein